MRDSSRAAAFADGAAADPGKEIGPMIPVIAIDGPAASGKSTIASLLAEKLGIIHINTGAMYRAVTLAILEAHLAKLDAPDKLAELLAKTRLSYRKAAKGEYILLLNGEDRSGELRSPEVSSLVSPVAAIPQVREFLKKMQRSCAEQGKLVMEGRDIGTVIFPDAQWKFFLTASCEVRARRRLAQSGETPDGSTLAEVAAAIAERDRIDSTRAVAPLKRAEDAIAVDTSDMTIDEVVEAISKHLK